MKKFNLSGRRQFKKELLITKQKLKTDVNRGVCYPRLRDFSKAFDKVNFKMLVKKMIDRKILYIFLRLYISTVKVCTVLVKSNKLLLVNGIVGAL